ncbi:unnamed protein product [Bathycoccus prasinos]
MRSRAAVATRSSDGNVCDEEYADEAAVKSSSISETARPNETNPTMWILLLCVGIVVGVVLSSSKSTAAAQKVHRSVKSAYQAHQKAKEGYLKAYREAYSETILASTTKEEEEEEEEEEDVEDRQNNNSLDEYGLPLGNSWFSHVHIAKTAGSSFAKDIARRYYGACGDKGVSCMEVLEDTERILGVSDKDTCSPKEKSIWHWENARKRGYHNCAIVSEEIHMFEWSKWILNSILHKNATKVALIPCRDPVSHFFSMNNYRNLNVTKMFEDGKSCEEVLNNRTIFTLFYPDRFQIDMDNATAPWDKLVLYKFDAIESVLKLLDKHLPLRNFPLESKKIMRTNQDRNPKNEQLNKCSERDLALEMKKLWSYYEFCEKNLPEGRDIAVLDVSKDGKVLM